MSSRWERDTRIPVDTDALQWAVREIDRLRLVLRTMRASDADIYGKERGSEDE